LSRSRRTIVVLALLAISANVYALDPARTLSQYVHRIWQAQQGLPQAPIYSIIEGGEGYLWLGTQAGLVKFDGARFTKFDEIDGVSTEKIWVTHLARGQNGTVWVGTNHDGLIKLNGRAVTRYSLQEGLPSSTVQCLVTDGEDNVWVCTSNGLAEMTRGRIRLFGRAEGLPTSDIRAACMAPSGTLTVTTGNAEIAVWTGTRFVSRAVGLLESATVHAMLCATDGTLWIGTGNGLVQVQGEEAHRLTVADGLADNAVLTLTEARDGSVLAGTKDGFSRVRSREIQSFRSRDGLSQSTVYSLYEDREGSLWAGTKRGLNQFLDGRAIPYTTTEGLPSNNAGPILQDRDGTIWVGTLGGGLAWFDGHRFMSLTTRAGLASNSIYSLAEDKFGDLWVGTGAGLNRLRNRRVTGTWTTRQGLPDDVVRTLVCDRDGALWIGTSHGPAVFRHGALQAAGSRSRVQEPFVGFAETRFQQLRAAPRLDARIMHNADAVYQDQDGLIWVSTLGDGLRLIDGEHAFTFSVVEGLPDDVIYGVVADDYGRLWMACSNGIFSVNRSDLRQVAAGKLHRFASASYSTLDLSRTVECQAGVQPVVSRMQDGRLWFSTIRGILVFDPSQLDRTYLPPTVVVEDAQVNGERRGAVWGETLPPGRNNIEFGYTGISFLAPTRISFRYMLEGFDATWIDAGARRQAFYTNLPAGRFRFRVAACNPGQACNETVDGVGFTIEPRYFQRVWFWPMCATAIALGGWTMYLLHIRRLKEQFHLILTERSRIARELHDTLIQGFSGVTMAMQALASQLPPSHERGTIEEIVADAGRSLSEGRQALEELRSGSDLQSGLSDAVAQLAHEVAETKKMSVNLNLVDCGLALPPDVQYNLLRIVREAVVNAVRHSGAHSLKVSVQSTAQRVEVSVKDDGVGFDEAELSHVGHYGLIGMRERAAHIGADLQMTSTLGQGTTVSVVMEM
jgi:signal transduction histidine kinase/ligand-binding sensor domain-containing protein